MDYVTTPLTTPLRGVLTPPGDKSISHRAVLFAAMAEGTSNITGLLDSADVRSTLNAVADLGARVLLEAEERGTLSATISGWGRSGPREPAGAIDCGNSGTTSRLLMGALAGWPISVMLVGDDSLSQRPMRRVTEPVGRMGACFDTAEGGTLPVTLHGGTLQPLDYRMPVASAQVKSALLLAGLRAPGRTVLREPAPSRDHTERMLPAFGIPIGRGPGTVWVEGPAVPSAVDLDVPGDPSSAAFVIGAACIIPGSDIVVDGVSLNPTRTGFVRVLRAMGADVDASMATTQAGEPVGRVRARYSPHLAGTTVEAGDIATLIDEVPLLAVVATQAEGETRFAQVGELRVKESDRLHGIVNALKALGGRASVDGDTLIVDGPSELHGAELDSLGDHRMAMAYAVAGLRASDEVRIGEWESITVSYPSFQRDIAALAGE